MDIVCLTFFLSSSTPRLNTDLPTSYCISESVMENGSEGPRGVNDQ